MKSNQKHRIRLVVYVSHDVHDELFLIAQASGILLGRLYELAMLYAARSDSFADSIPDLMAAGKIERSK